MSVPDTTVSESAMADGHHGVLGGIMLAYKKLKHPRLRDLRKKHRPPFDISTTIIDSLNSDHQHHVE